MNLIANLPPAVGTEYAEAQSEFIKRDQDNLGGIYLRGFTEQDSITERWNGQVAGYRKKGSEIEGPTFDGVDKFKTTIEMEQWIMNGRRFHSSEAVGRNIGEFQENVRNILQDILRIPDDIVGDLLKNGESTKAGDGENFFGPKVTDVRPNNNIVNGDSNSDTDPEALSRTIGKIKAAFRKFVTLEGTSTSIMPKVFVIPPDLEETFNVALNSAGSLADNKNSSVVNPRYNESYRIVSTSRLTNNKEFYALDPRIPFAKWWTRRQNITPEAPSPTFVEIKPIYVDAYKITNNWIGFSAELWGGAGYINPNGAIKVKYS